MRRTKLLLFCLILLVTSLSSIRAQVVEHCKVVTEKINSTVLRENKIGCDPVRNVWVLLPPGYETSGKRYPVVYYCHNIFWSADKIFSDGRLATLVERGFAKGVVKKFILVAADYSTPTTGSIYENSPTSGRWIDFTVNELVKFVDSKFRTIPHPNSRAITGDFMGGRGALNLAMKHADVFGLVYALNPVAAGTGDIPWSFVGIDWRKILNAKSPGEITDGRTKLFITFCQAYLPNASRPPFYCDFFMELKDGEPTLHVQNLAKVRKGLLLDANVEENLDNLKSLKGIAFDWGRFDETRAHVTSNRELSRILEDLGIKHEAEEYAGSPFNKTWTDNGRFYTRLLPFIEQHLVYDEGKAQR
jgi:S-formylglutathione hydrolase FrmB